MKNLPSARFVFDRHGRASVDKKGLVQIEVAYLRRRKWFSTNVKVYPSQWDEQKHVVNSPESLELNKLLAAQMKKVTDYMTEIIDSGVEFSFDRLSYLLEYVSERTSFVSFVDERVNSRTDIGEGTRKHHRTFLDALTKYGKIVWFEDLTKARILDFYEWVQRKGIQQTTVYNYMKIFKVYVNQAIARGIIDKDPFLGVKIERGKNALRTFLTEEELEKLVNADITVSPVKKARDLFVFQCYTGMAYIDMMEFDFERDVTERDGKYIVTSRRMKSDEDFYLVLMKPAIDILRRYDYKLPHMANQPYNNYIKVAVAQAGINKSVSSHSGRHTFAVMALNNNIQMEVVAKMLGHSDIRTTKVYAKVLNTSVEDAFAKLEKKVGGKRIS